MQEKANFIVENIHKNCLDVSNLSYITRSVSLRVKTVPDTIQVQQMKLLKISISLIWFSGFNMSFLKLQ